MLKTNFVPLVRFEVSNSRPPAFAESVFPLDHKGFTVEIEQH